MRLKLNIHLVWIEIRSGFFYAFIFQNVGSPDPPRANFVATPLHVHMEPEHVVAFFDDFTTGCGRTVGFCVISSGSRVKSYMQ